jgi:branched-chain amino acid transport system ATP-binding protein
MTALLTTRGLGVRFGGLKAVDDVDLDVPTGAICGLIGPNGAGKTTLFNAISGLVAISGGEIAFNDQPLTRAPAHRRARLGIRRTFQSVQLAQDMSVLENVMIGLDATRHESVLRTLFGLDPRKSMDWEGQAAVRRTLDLLGIGELALRPVRSLTFGQQRYVEVARALVSRPALLMLDEPAAGLGPAELEAFEALLQRLRAETGLTILLVEHVISLVFNVCDRVTVLEAGRVIAEGSPGAIAADPTVKRAYLGEDDDAAA